MYVSRHPKNVAYHYSHTHEANDRSASLETMIVDPAGEMSSLLLVDPIVELSTHNQIDHEP